jgi:hypothetical protein
VDSNVTLNQVIIALREGYFLLFLIAILFLWALSELKKTFKAFHEEKPMKRLAVTTFLLFIITGGLLYFQFHKTNKVPVNIDHEEINKQIQCTHGEDDCEFDGGNLNCDGFEENNDSQYDCTFENRIRATFTWPDQKSETLKLENVFYEIDDLKLSTDDAKLYATFNLHSPVTDQMIDLPDKKINVSMCGMSQIAAPNKNSTYTFTVDWKDFETMAQKNCKDHICIDQNEKGCYAKNTFNIIIPFNKKYIRLKENAYIFYGHVRQNDISIPINGTNFEIKARVRLLSKAACFTLVAGGNTIKIENDMNNSNEEANAIVSLNKKAADIANLASNEIINITIQRNSQNFIVYIGQEGGIGEQIILQNPKAIKDHIEFGFTIANKTKGEVLELNIDQTEESVK